MAKQLKNSGRKERSPAEKKLGKKKPGSLKGQKKDKKPAFQRFRDESRPSDFGSSIRREQSTTNDTSSQKRKEKKNVDSNKANRFEGKGNKQPKSFGNQKFTSKPSTYKKRNEVNPHDIDDRDYENNTESHRDDRGRDFKKTKPNYKKSGSSSPQRVNDDGLTRLNKYLSNAGVCSRREADQLIATGVVQVNGKTITEMGFKVKPTDVVNYGGQTLKKERHVYLILNKPKDYITTADDPKERKIVLDLVRNACKERIYPVGRLDRATTGLLMLTNDGDLTKRLTHPRYGVKKLYHVVLDKPLKRIDIEKITAGLELEDGPIKVDEIVF